MSRLGRTAARARQLWIGMRVSAYTEQMRTARRGRPIVEELESPPPPPAESGGGDDGTGPPPPEVAEGLGSPSERPYVPTGLAVGAAWSWRLIVIAAAVVAVLYALGQVAIVAIPVVVSFLLAALFQPIAAWLIRHKWNKSLASIVVLIAGLAAVAAVFTFVIDQFIKGIPEFGDQITKGFNEVEAWLKTGPYGIDEEAMGDVLANLETTITDWMEANQSTIATSAFSIAGSTAVGLGYFFTGFFLVLFSTYFFMRDGRKIWMFITGMFPRDAREPVRYAGGAGWSTLVQYMRTMAIVALVDAVGIGLGLWILGIPMWLPLATLVFLGAFIPIIGATVSGAVAVLVALIGTDNGLVNALIVLAIVLGVQQIESNLLHPILMSRAVKLHPLAIVLAVTAGGVIAGIIGALIAVPLLAIVNGSVRALHRFREARREPGETTTDSGEESVQPA